MSERLPAQEANRLDRSSSRVTRAGLLRAAGTVVLVGVGGGLASCSALGGAREAAPPPAEVAGALRLGATGPLVEMPVWEEMVRRFRAEQPKVQIEIEHFPDLFQEKLLTLAAGGSLWDVYRAFDEPFYGNVERGVFHDITQYWTRDQREINSGDFVEGQADFWRWDKKAKVGGTKAGRVFATPRDGGMQLFVYNKRVFRDAGVEPPGRDGRWTWNEFLDVSRRLTKREGDKLVRAGWDFLPNWYHTMMWSAPKGLELLDTKRRKSEVNQPAMIDTLRQIQDYRLRHAVVPAPSDFPDVRNKRTRVARGLAGMMIDNAVFTVFRSEFKDDPDNWEAAHIPRDPQTGKRTARASWGGMGVGAQTRAPEAAWQFTKYIASVEGQKLWPQLGRAMPSRLSVLKSDVFNDPKTIQDEAVWIEALSYQKYQPITEQWDGTDRIWKFWWTKMMEEGLPPQQVVPQIDQQVNHLLQTGQEPVLR